MEIAININADNDYFGVYLKDNYPAFEGLSVRETTVFVHGSYTEQEITDITTYYNALSTESIHTKHIKIYDFISDSNNYNNLVPPFDVDYIRTLTARLQPVITDMYKGEVREITYYVSAVLNPDKTLTGTTPVIKEVHEYTRDTDKIALTRLITISWYRVDETISPTEKTRLKYYTGDEAIKEGVRRRTNITDGIQIPVVGMLMATEGMTSTEALEAGSAMMDQYASEIQSYIQTPKLHSFQDAVTNDTDYLWLDNVIDGEGTTIRLYILDALDY